MLLASDVTCLFPDLKALIKPSIALPATLFNAFRPLSTIFTELTMEDNEDSADFALLAMDFTD